MSQFRVRGELSLDGSKWSAGLARAQSQAQRFAGVVSSSVGSRLAAMFSVGASAAFARSTIEWASNLRDVADTLGVNVEWLQRMANGAGLVGGKLEDIQRLMQEVNKSREDALANPQGKNAQAFARLGISSGELGSLNPQAFLERMIKAFAGGSNAQLENAVAEVGGRSAKNLIAAFVAQFESDSPVASEEIINQLDDIGDKFFELATLLKVQLAPAIVSAIRYLSNGIGLLNQSRAGVGGFMTGFLTKFDARDPGVKNFFKSIADGLEEGWKQLQRDVVSEANDQENSADAAAAVAAVRARVRRQRESQGLGGVSEAARNFGAPPSDSLVRVGNFLGDSGGKIMTNISGQQLEAQRRMVAHLQRIEQHLSRNDLGIS